MTKEKTGSDLECERISKMSESELLDYVLEHPDYVYDNYYSAFRSAIHKRHDELVAARCAS
jgi:hypothetical protein